MRTLLCAMAAASVLLAAPVSGQDQLYKWVDEDGNVSYQDRPPPDDSGEVETFQQSSTSAPTLPDVDVVLYTIPVCDACDLVRNILAKRSVPFDEKNVEGDAEAQAELKEVAGVLSVPILVIGDQVIPGYNKQLIVNELDEAGFTEQAIAASQPAQPAHGESLTREQLETMTPEEIEQAARDAVSRGEDNDLFEEDEGFATLNEDLFSGTADDDPADSDDITQLEEIPEDERIRVGE